VDRNYRFGANVMNRIDTNWARQFINTQDWRFAKTMPQWPHWYIVRGESNRCGDFDRLAALIKGFGVEDAWGAERRRYLRIGEHKYWVLGEIINRAAPIPSAEVRRRGKLWLERHGKTVGPYGNLIPIKKQVPTNTSRRSRMEAADDWGAYLARDPEQDEHQRWLNSHCLVGYRNGKGVACGTSLVGAPHRIPDEGRWVYFLPPCGHVVHRSRSWLEELRNEAAERRPNSAQHPTRPRS
jgi:hypothetical protein